MPSLTPIDNNTITLTTQLPTANNLARIETPLTTTSIGTPHNSLTSIPMSQLINTAPLQVPVANHTSWQNLLSSSATLACVRTGLPSGSIVLQPQFATLPGVTLGNNGINRLPLLQAGSHQLNTIAGLAAAAAGGRVSTIPQVLSLAQIPTTLGNNKDFSSLPLIAIQLPTSTIV